MKFTGPVLAIGLVFGDMVGILIGNQIFSTAEIMVLGFAIGTVLDNRSPSKNS